MSRNANFNQWEANEVLSPPPRPISLVQQSPEEQINHRRHSPPRPRSAGRVSAVEKVISLYNTAHKELLQLHTKNRYKSDSSKEIVAKVLKLQGEVTLLMCQLEKEEAAPDSPRRPRRPRAQGRRHQAQVDRQDNNQVPVHPAGAGADMVPPPPRADPQFPRVHNEIRPPVRAQQYLHLPREQPHFPQYLGVPNHRFPQQRLPPPPPVYNQQQQQDEVDNFYDRRHYHHYEY